jgi:predicted component of viral defense system (DUF524 family)
LRPDATVIIKTKENTVKLIFDAKYKVDQKNRLEKNELHVKQEDIHKMHTYVDAIENALFSFVVYPGTEFYFFERNINSPTRKSIDEIQSFDGVGAIPLTPDNIEQYRQLDLLAIKIKNLLLG